MIDQYLFIQDDHYDQTVLEQWGSRAEELAYDKGDYLSVQKDARIIVAKIVYVAEMAEAEPS